mmetsp:Transcript_3122/g.6433  ORF Transcript_3122/g.6433 Transcript_3122/m.6433 type:complete len:283 (-) Transcript_3122:103-951(-)
MSDLVDASQSDVCHFVIGVVPDAGHHHRVEDLPGGLVLLGGRDGWSKGGEFHDQGAGNAGNGRDDGEHAVHVGRSQVLSELLGVLHHHLGVDGAKSRTHVRHVCTPEGDPGEGQLACGRQADTSNNGDKCKVSPHGEVLAEDGSRECSHKGRLHCLHNLDKRHGTHAHRNHGTEMHQKMADTLGDNSGPESGGSVKLRSLTEASSPERKEPEPPNKQLDDGNRIGKVCNVEGLLVINIVQSVESIPSKDKCCCNAIVSHGIPCLSVACLGSLPLEGSILLSL